jgi:transforming growth factor-beta-induced protein
MAADVVGLTSAPTVLGQDITITVKDGNVFLNDTIQVIITDIEASNGVIHVIDAVLLPN